jgi:hypothetical protein
MSVLQLASFVLQRLDREGGVGPRLVGSARLPPCKAVRIMAGRVKALTYENNIIHGIQLWSYNMEVQLEQHLMTRVRLSSFDCVVRD